MKTAIYMENGVTQIALTPENDWEAMAVKELGRTQIVSTVHRGQFYHCVGGWIRQGPDTESVMLTLGESKNENPHL